MVFKEGSDRKKKRVSKKNKKSWRKHTDTKDIDSFLDEKRLEERLGHVTWLMMTKYSKGRRSYITLLITCLISELHLLTEKMRSYSKSTRKQMYSRKLFSPDVKRSYWSLLNVLPFLTNVPQCQIQSKRGNILLVEVEYNNNNNKNYYCCCDSHFLMAKWMLTETEYEHQRNESTHWLRNVKQRGKSEVFSNRRKLLHAKTEL